MSDHFSSIAHIYRETATAQKYAAERLFWMLRIERTDDVLDLGCGTGHLAQEIRQLTDGRVVGIDLSPEMVALAQEAAPKGIEFVTGSAEDLDMPGQFDAIFCNSAFQWFTEPRQGDRQLLRGAAAGRPDGHAGSGPSGVLPDVSPCCGHAGGRPADRGDLEPLRLAVDLLRDGGGVRAPVHRRRLRAGRRRDRGAQRALHAEPRPGHVRLGRGRRVPEPRVLRRAAAGRVPGDGARADPRGPAPVRPGPSAGSRSCSRASTCWRVAPDGARRQVAACSACTSRGTPDPDGRSG